MKALTHMGSPVLKIKHPWFILRTKVRTGISSPSSQGTDVNLQVTGINVTLAGVGSSRELNTKQH